MKKENELNVLCGIYPKTIDLSDANGNIDKDVLIYWLKKNAVYCTPQNFAILKRVCLESYGETKKKDVERNISVEEEPAEYGSERWYREFIKEGAEP